jgi:hypothetical protein
MRCEKHEWSGAFAGEHGGGVGVDEQSRGFISIVFLLLLIAMLWF